MNKKGFTLVELIAVIAIMIIITLIIVPNVNKIINNNRIKLYQNQETRLEEAALKYINEIDINPNTDSVTIQKNELVSSGYISEIIDIKDKTSVCNAYIIINNIQTSAEATTYLSCENYVTTGYDVINLE